MNLAERTTPGQTGPRGGGTSSENEDRTADALLRHAQGDKDAFAQLVTMHSSPIYGYLTRCGVHPAERDDLFQDILIKVHRAATDHPPSGPARPWLFTIAVNTVRSHFRKVKVRKVVQLDADPARGKSAHESTPEAETSARQTASWLEDEIQKLPLDQREVLVLCAIEGVDQKEVAATLDMPVNTVKTKLRRARLALAEARCRRKLAAAREAQR